MLGGLPLHKHTALCSHLRKHVLPASSRLLQKKKKKKSVHTLHYTGTQKGRLLLLHPATRGCRQCAHIVPVLASAQDSFRQQNKNKPPDVGSARKKKPRGGKEATMGRDGIHTYIFLCRDMTAHVSAWTRVYWIRAASPHRVPLSFFFFCRPSPSPRASASCSLDPLMHTFTNNARAHR